MTRILQRSNKEIKDVSHLYKHIQIGGGIEIQKPLVIKRAFDATNNVNNIVDYLYFKDKNDIPVLIQRVYSNGADENLVQFLTAYRNTDGSNKYNAILSIINNIENGNGYLTCTGPKNNYANDIAVTRWVTDNYSKNDPNTLNIYIDEINGVDTTNLHSTRGTIDEPFKTLNAAHQYVTLYYNAKNPVHYKLLSDINITTTIYLYLTKLFSLIIESNSASDIKTIYFTNSRIQVEGGRCEFKNINLEAKSGVSVFTTAYMQAIIMFSTGVSMNGTIFGAAVSADVDSTIFVNGIVNGTVIGKKHNVSRGGKLILPNGLDSLPGSEAGVVDNIVVIR